MEISNIFRAGCERFTKREKGSLCASVTERENGTVRTGERKRREMERVE
jgi:hypothetical protein